MLHKTWYQESCDICKFRAEYYKKPIAFFFTTIHKILYHAYHIKKFSFLNRKYEFRPYDKNQHFYTYSSIILWWRFMRKYSKRLEMSAAAPWIHTDWFLPVLDTNDEFYINLLRNPTWITSGARLILVYGKQCKKTQHTHIPELPYMWDLYSGFGIHSYFERKRK